MKFKIFSMLVILAVLSIMPMIYMGKFDPAASIDSMLGSGTSEFKKLKAKVPKNLTSVVTDKKVQVYKWRDERGVMQFSNTPPADGGQAERVELNPNKNIVDAVKIPVQESAEKEVAKAEAPNPYSPKGMKKVIDDARGIEQLLKQRDENQQKMLNNL
jgi:hypothetical protein